MDIRKFSDLCLCYNLCLFFGTIEKFGYFYSILYIYRLHIIRSLEQWTCELQSVRRTISLFLFFLYLSFNKIVISLLILHYFFDIEESHFSQNFADIVRYFNTSNNVNRGFVN